METANEVLFWANIATIPFNLASGYISDKISYRIIYPVSSIVMGIGWGLFLIANNPYDIAGITGEILLSCGVTVHTLSSYMTIKKY